MSSGVGGRLSEWRDGGRVSCKQEVKWGFVVYGSTSRVLD